MLLPRPCIARRLAPTSFKNVCFNSTSADQSGPKRVTSWGDIHIPSRDELNESKKTSQSTSLATRLMARKWTRVDKSPNQPISAQTTPRTTTSASFNNYLPPSNTLAADPVAVGTSPVNTTTTQHIPPVLHVPNHSQSISKKQPITQASQDDVWAQMLKSSRQGEDDYFSGTEATFSGRQWIPGMAQSGKKVGAQRARKDRAKDGSRSDKREGRKRAFRDVKAATNADKSAAVAKVNRKAEEPFGVSEELYADEEAISEGHHPDDDSIIDDISLYGPAAGQTKEEWISDLVMQGREPEAPDVQSADVRIAADFDGLFCVSSVAVASQHLQQLHEPRAAVKQGKVDYQIRRILRKYGGDYSYLQPQIESTDLERLPPSKLAQFAISRRHEVGTRQRKILMEIVAPATRSVEQQNVRK